MVIPPALAATAASAATSLISNAVGALSGAGSSSSTQSTKSNDSLDQADFMQLLIAQLQNQDPLNPLDSTTFAAQLAQFSSLEQLTQINQRLAQGTDGGASTGVEAVGLLGHQVNGSLSSISVAGGTPSTLDYTLPSAGAVNAQISDANGNVVATVPVGSETAGTHTFDLSAIKNAPKLVDGTYTVALTLTSSNGANVPVTTSVSGQVTGVDLSVNPPVLLIGGTRLPLADVTSVDASASGGSATSAS